MKIHCLYNKLVSLSELKPHPQNRNQHPQVQIDRLAQILKYQGWRYPVKVSKQSGYITSGHGRVLAAKINGWTEVPVNYQDYESSDQEYADVQADNAIASWAELDLSSINTDLGELGPDFNIEVLGIRNLILEPSERIDLQNEWTDMPEFNQPDKTSHRHVIVHFVSDDGAAQFFKLIKQPDTGKTKSVWFPPQERMDTESKLYG